LSRENPGGQESTGASAIEFGKKRGRKEDLRSLGNSEAIVYGAWRIFYHPHLSISSSLPRKIAVHGFRNLSVIRILFGFEHAITKR
jgi:hypothetical protein